MWWLTLVCAALGGCASKSSPVAELTKATGPVEREIGGEAWRPAVLGTQYFVGDAARTWDGGATLDITGGGGARIVMQSRTVLRFAGGDGKTKIAVESGAVELTGGGTYPLDLGDVVLSQNGTVRVTAKGPGRSSMELMIGEGAVTTTTETFDLVLNRALDLDLAQPRVAVVREPRAPPVPDGAAVRVEDAGVVDAAGEGDGATVEIKGRTAQLLAPGETAWKPLPPGTVQLLPGSAVRVTGATTARLVASGTTIDLAGGATVRLGDDRQIALELGTGIVTTTGSATIGLPGGTIAFTGAPDAPASARLDGSARDTKVTMTRGTGSLVGTGGTDVPLSRGEAVALGRTGAIRVIEAIPRYFDLRVAAGESPTLHDPRPPSAVQFLFAGKCDAGGIVEIDRDARFRTPRVSAGREFANVMIAGGNWAYRLRCTVAGGDGPAVAAGRVSVLRDDGRRPLPRAQALNDIDADGRNYRISYQSAIPDVAVRVPNPGAVHRLHLATGGKEQTFDSITPVITVPGAQLREGTYTYWIDRNNVKQDKVSTLTIDFDQTAPQVYIESPINARPWLGDIDVRGAVLPGWEAAVEGVAVPIDRHRRFAAKIGIPSGGALAIRLAHPQRGVHYYLRRPE